MKERLRRSLATPDYWKLAGESNENLNVNCFQCSWPLDPDLGEAKNCSTCQCLLDIRDKLNGLLQAMDKEGPMVRPLSQCRLCLNPLANEQRSRCDSCWNQLQEWEQGIEGIQERTKSKLVDCQIFTIVKSADEAIILEQMSDWTWKPPTAIPMRLFVTGSEYELIQSASSMDDLLDLGFRLTLNDEHWLEVYSREANALANTLAESEPGPGFFCTKCEHHQPESFQRVLDHVLDCSSYPKELTSQVNKCDKSFDSRKHEIDQHDVTEKGSFECPTCSKMFYNRSRFTAHERIHAGEKPYPCERCSKSFTRKASLLEHMARHDGIRDKECHVCKKKFYHTSFWRHMSTVHPQEKNLRYPCLVCDKVFAQKYKLDLHAQTHISYAQRKFVCEKCPDKRFSTLDYLKNHHKIVHESKESSNSFLCDDCGITLSTKTSLQVHRKKLHLDEKSPNFACQSCPLVFSSQNLLAKHEKAIHTSQLDNQGKNAISVAESQTTSLETAAIELLVPVSQSSNTDLLAQSVEQNIPMLSFEGDKADLVPITNEAESVPHQILVQTDDGTFFVPLEVDHSVLDGTTCEKCHKSFKTRKAKSQHMRNVHSEKVFPCSLCAKTFNNLHYLKVHQKIHATDKDIECDICHRTFKFVKELTRHMRVHTGEKPYRCEDCGKCFSHTSNLSEHRTLHTGQMNFECSNCPEKFRLWSLMRKHQIKCEGGPSRESQFNVIGIQDLSILNSAQVLVLSPENPNISQFMTPQN